VAPLKHLLEYSIPLVKVNGYYIAMKSEIAEEIKNINIYEKELSIVKEKEIKFYLPKENSLRTLLIYQKKKECSLNVGHNV
jgi:16S rRNA (guanine527-N7)-methyltransferase